MDDITLIDDVVALGICAEARNEDVGRRWTSEELLSTCDALVKSSLPSHPTKEEIRLPEEAVNLRDSLDSDLILDINHTGLIKKNWDSNHSHRVDYRTSLASSSSSFSSCESALEKCVLEMREGSPLIYHSCSSLRVDCEESAKGNSNDRSSPQEAEFTPELGECLNEIDIGSDSQLVHERGRALDDSKISDSVPLNHELVPDHLPIRFADSVGDEKVVNEILNKDDAKCLCFPEYEKGIDTGVEKNIFPSLIVPSCTAAVSAKDAKAFDVSRDLFCLTSEKEFQNSCYGVFSAGEIKDKKYEIKINKEGHDANSYASAANEGGKNNLFCEFPSCCEGNNENVKDDGLEKLLKCQIAAPEESVCNLKLGVSPSATLPFKSDIMNIMYVNYFNKDLTPRTSQGIKQSDESSYCTDISDNTDSTMPPSELNDQNKVKVTVDPTITGSCKVPGKRMSNLFHAVPIFIRDELESNSCFLDYVVDQRPCSSINTENVNKSHENFNNYNMQNVTSRALKIKPSNDCQSFLSIGTASDFVVSNEFGATEVAVDLQREYLGKKSVGEVQFSVRNTLWSFPIYHNASPVKGLPGYFAWELRLAWRGSNWNLSVDDNGRPVIIYGKGMAECELKHEEPSRQQFTSKLYGFTIISEENSRVKNLVPLFNEKSLNDWNKDGRRSSICTSVALRSKNVVSGNKRHRNSAMCDMKMYRTADQFVPVDENESIISGNENTDDRLQLCSVILDSSALNEVPSEGAVREAEQTENSFDNDTLDTLKPASVLRSKSDSRIKFENKENEAASRSISLHDYDAENASNLSNFKGVTMEDLPSSEMQAAAFLSSFLEQSMHPERVSSRDKNEEKSLSGKECSFENLGVVNHGVADLGVSCVPYTVYPDGCLQSNVSNLRNITTVNITPSSNRYSPSQPEILEYINDKSNDYIRPDSQVSSAVITSAVHIKCDTSCYEPLYPAVALTSHLESKSTYSSSFMPTSLASFFVTSGNSLVPVSTSITYASADIKLNNMPNHMSPLPSLETQCYVTHATPSTKMSILPVTQSSLTNEGALALLANEHSPLKYGFPSPVTGEVMPQHSIVLNADNFCNNKTECSEKQSLDISSIKEDRGSTLKKRAVDIAKQQGALPPRPTYSTKFPMDIICQGRLQEVKRKTAPPGEFSNAPVEEHRFRRKRISSVGQVKPLASYLKENYPTTRSKSAGRMDFGSTRFPFSRSLSENTDEKISSKPLDCSSILSEVEEDVFSTPAASMDEVFTLSVSKIDDTFFSCKDRIVDTSAHVEDSDGNRTSKDIDTMPVVKHVDSYVSFTKDDKLTNHKDISDMLESVKNIIETPVKMDDIVIDDSGNTTCDNSLSSEVSNLLPKNIICKRLEDDAEIVHEIASSYISVLNVPQNLSADNKRLSSDIFTTFVNSFVSALIDMKILFPLIKDHYHRVSTRSKDRGRHSRTNILHNVNISAVPDNKKDILLKPTGEEKEIKQRVKIDQNYLPDVSVSTGGEFYNSPGRDTSIQRISEGLSVGMTKGVLGREINILPGKVCLKTLPPDKESKNKNLIEYLNKVDETIIPSSMDTSFASCGSSLQTSAMLNSNLGNTNVTLYSRTSRSPEPNDKATVSEELCTPSDKNTGAGSSPDKNYFRTSRSPDNGIYFISQKSFTKLTDENYVGSSKSSDTMKRAGIIPETTFRTIISPESSRLRINESPNKTGIAVTAKRSFSKSPERTGLVISTERRSLSRSPEKTGITLLTKETSNQQSKKLSADMLPEKTGIILAAKRSFSKSPERTGLTISSTGSANKSSERVNIEKLTENSLQENLEKVGVCKSEEIRMYLETSSECAQLELLGNKKPGLVHLTSKVEVPTPALIKSKVTLAAADDEEIHEGEVHDSFPSVTVKPTGSGEELDTVKSVMEFSHYKVVDLDESDDTSYDDSSGLNVTLKSELELKLDPDDKSGSELKINLNLSSEGLKADQPLKSELNIDADVLKPHDKFNIRNTQKELKSFDNDYGDKDRVDALVEPLSQISLPETTKSLSFVVEEILDFIDVNSSFMSTNHREDERVSPSTAPPLSATLSFPIRQDMPGSSHSAGEWTVKDKKSDSKRSSATRSFGSEEQKSEFFSVRAEIVGDRITYSNGTAASTPAPAVAYSFRSEDEFQSSCDRQQIGEEVLASVVPSSTASALSWGNGNRGPVARRDLFPLEDEDVTPQWNALLEVNAPDSDEDRTGYESDDDFENMDAEMRRLEEKLKKFERELGVMSSGEDVDLPADTTINDTAKSSIQENLKIPRLRQEDIDVLKSFSLPDVYPPVNILKTKHLSLMTKEEDLLDEDEDEEEREINHLGSESGNSSSLLFMKPLRKLKPGERRCRSLNLQKLFSKRGSKCSNSKYSNFNSVLINTTTQSVDVANDSQDQKSEVDLPIEYKPLEKSKLAGSSEEQRFRDDQFPHVEVRYIDDDKSPSEEEEQEDKTVNVESNAGSADFRYCSFDCLVGEDTCDGYLWRNSGSEMAVFDFDGLDELQEVYQVTEHCLFFIFEDDSEDQEEVTADTCSPSVIERGTFLLPLSKEMSKLHENDDNGYSLPDRPFDKDISSSYKKKRDVSLVSAFKNSFRKAAKYLGPNPFHNKGKDEEEVEDYFTKHLLPSPLYDDNDEGASGKYNVSNARVVNDPTDVEELPSSGEYYAYPAVCVMTSDEESLSKDRTDVVTDNSPSELLEKHVELEANQLPSGDSGSTNARVVHDSVGTNGESTSLQDNFASEKVPPPVPPRRSHLISDLAEKTVKIAEGLKTYCLEEDAALGKPAVISSVDASGNVTHKPTSLRQIKRKQQERIETQKIEEALESTDCTFCVGVPAFYRGRTDQQAGNHNRHPSPHPRVLPERRTWPPRK